MGRTLVDLLASLFLLAATLLGSTGCAALAREKPRLAYAPEEFAAALLERVPALPARLAEAPFVIDPAIVERGEAHMLKAPRGPARVQALVDFLSMPQPQGLGLAYDWSATGSARATLALGRGNCVALASVLIALGRGLDWPIYYAEARSHRPQTQEFASVTVVSDHMVVLLAAQTFRMVIDFTGLLDELEDLRPIDDLTAYAHIVNNMSAQHVLGAEAAPTHEQWQAASNGFQLATRIAPELGRAWNNLGIALTRLERFEEAREAYNRAVELDTAFGSAKRNLSVMETRAAGEPSILETPPSR